MQFRWKWPLNLKNLTMLVASIMPLIAYGLAHGAFPASWQGPLGGLVIAYTAVMYYVNHAASPDVQDPGVMGAASGPTAGDAS